MEIGVLRETAPGERRVAVTPEVVQQLIKSGHRVSVQSGAGMGADLSDEDYRTAGAEVTDLRTVAACPLLVGVRMPQEEVVQSLRAGSVLVAALAPLVSPKRMNVLSEQGLIAFSLDVIPRITRAQSMDILSATSTVAGYRAVILGAELARRFFPMLMTAAGTVPPAKVLVIGAGVAGLQAVATARRLGAVVQAFDARPATREQVESLGALFLALPELEAEGTGGYARAVAAEEEAREREFLGRYVQAADVVVTTAMVPGSRAPVLIDEDMVRSMHAGAVILDLAAEAGGNCAVTVPGERVTVHGVVVEGATDLGSQMALPASQLFARAMWTYLRHLMEQGLAWDESSGTVTVPELTDEIVRSTLITRGGRIVHEATLAKLGPREELSPTA